MINVTRSYLPDRKKLDSYIDQIYDSAWLTNNGPLAQELEIRLKNYLGVKNLILVSNGTLALQVAYKALNLSGSAVTTPFSFVATSSSLAWEGIQPIFADIDPKTWNLDPEKIEREIKADTSAIVPVHVFGNPCDVERIDFIAKRFNLKVVYDAAHAFGVNFKGSSILNWGNASTLSFHATKLFHTIEGGAIITADDELAKRIRSIINFGITGPEKIEFVGINCKLNEFQAAMGLCVLDDIEDILMHRKKVTEIYRSLLSSKIEMQAWNCCSSQNYHYYPILVDSEEKLFKLQDLLKLNEILPRRYFYPSLDSLNCFAQNDSCSISKDIASRIICLPISSYLTENDLQRISYYINEAIKQ